MSDKTDNPEQAVEVLMESIYLPAFIKSCVENGVPINDEQSLHSALDIAAKLNYLEVAEVQNTASAAGGLMKQASDVLSDQFTEMGLEQPVQEKKASSTVNDERVLNALNQITAAASS